MTPLVLGPEQRQALAQLREWASAHPVNVKGLLETLAVPLKQGEAHGANGAAVGHHPVWFHSYLLDRARSSIRDVSPHEYVLARTGPHALS
jgi:hypothetical protein